MNQASNDGYQTPEFQNEITLQLSRNESKCAIDNLKDRLAELDPTLISSYPAHQELQNQLGVYCDIPADRIVVTAGGDDGIDRIIRHALRGSAKTIVTHAPSFEMVDIYCRNHGGSMAQVPWLEGDFPVKEFVDQINQETALAVLTSPNNPTGGVISLEVIEEVNQAAKKVGAKLLIDRSSSSMGLSFSSDVSSSKISSKRLEATVDSGTTTARTHSGQMTRWPDFFELTEIVALHSWHSNSILSASANVKPRIIQLLGEFLRIVKHIVRSLNAKWYFRSSPPKFVLNL